MLTLKYSSGTRALGDVGTWGCEVSKGETGIGTEKGRWEPGTLFFYFFTFLHCTNLTSNIMAMIPAATNMTTTICKKNDYQVHHRKSTVNVQHSEKASAGPYIGNAIPLSFFQIRRRRRSTPLPLARPPSTDTSLIQIKINSNQISKSLTLTVFN